MMDERIIAILKTVALEVINDDDGSIYCAFDCGGDRTYSDSANKFNTINHKPTCETVIARNILSEQGIPLYKYAITSEVQDTMSKRSDNWHPITEYGKAFSEQEARDKYLTPMMQWKFRRNLKIECVGEL